MSISNFFKSEKLNWNTALNWKKNGLEKKWIHLYDLDQRRLEAYCMCYNHIQNIHILDADADIGPKTKGLNFMASTYTLPDKIYVRTYRINVAAYLYAWYIVMPLKNGQMTILAENSSIAKQ